MSDLAARARTLLELHRAEEVLALANVWDVVSARVVAGTPGALALATASHSIAATFGYDDGEHIPLELHLDMVGRIVQAVDLPVTMDLEPATATPGRRRGARSRSASWVATSRTRADRWTTPWPPSRPSSMPAAPPASTSC